MGKHFTKEQIDEIRRQLATDAVRDTDFPETDSFHGEDYVAIVQDGRNKRLSCDTFRNELQNGPQGESTYEIAVRHGYTGTEEEWLAAPLDGQITMVNNGTIVNAPNGEDIEATETQQLQFADRAGAHGMGYCILRRNKTFAEQVTKINTIYEIRYDFDLDEESVTIPENCVLKFNGGCVVNGTLVGQNTGIEADSVKVFDTDVTISGVWSVEGWQPEWFGAKGDGETDDTEALQILNGKTILLQEKTYIASNLVYNSYTSILGVNKFTSCLKQKAQSHGDFILLIDWFAGRLENIRVQGVSDTTYDSGAWMPALVKMGNYTYNHYDGDRNWDETDRSTYYSSINNVVIRDAVKCGLTVLGNTTQEGHTYWWNYIHHISNLWVTCCGEYGIYDNATDNLWSNINVSHCGFADLYIAGSSEVFTTLKLDGQPGFAIDTDTPVDTVLWDRYKGAALVIIGSGIIIDGLDVQSSKYSGIKLDGSNCKISGTVNNCGLAFNDLASQYKCPAILFYGQNKNTENQINLVVYQLDSYGIKGAGVLEYREQGVIRDNSVDILYRPYDNNLNHESYKVFQTKLQSFGKKNEINCREEDNIGIVYYDNQTPSTGDYFRVATVNEWKTKNQSSLVPQGILVPCSTGDFILSLYNLGGQNANYVISDDVNFKLYGNPHAFDPLSDGEGLETTYGNVANEALYEHSAFNEVTSFTFENCQVSHWYIWTAAQAMAVMKNVYKINRILNMLGGHEINVDYQYAKYWTSTLYTDKMAYYYHAYQGMLYPSNSNVECYVRPVADFLENLPLYSFGSSELRGTMDDYPKPVGHKYYDTTLGRFVDWNGTGWVDADGGTSSGYKVLDGSKSFSSQVTAANMVYEIRDEFDLDGGSVTIPAGCTLKFVGGKITNGTLVGQNTGIEAGIAQIFDTDITLSGRWNVAEAYPEWFGAKGDGVNDDRSAIQKCVESFINTHLSSKTYVLGTKTNDVCINLPERHTLTGENNFLVSKPTLKATCTPLWVIAVNDRCRIESVSIDGGLDAQGGSYKELTKVCGIGSKYEWAAGLIIRNNFIYKCYCAYNLVTYLSEITHNSCLSCYYGFFIHGYGMTTPESAPSAYGTSTLIEGNYSNRCQGYGYAIIGMSYSTIQANAADDCGYDGNEFSYSYYFRYLKNTTILSNGSEQCMFPFYFVALDNVTVQNCSCWLKKIDGYLSSGLYPITYGGLTSTTINGIWLDTSGGGFEENELDNYYILYKSGVGGSEKLSEIRLDHNILKPTQVRIFDSSDASCLKYNIPSIGDTAHRPSGFSYAVGNGTIYFDNEIRQLIIWENGWKTVDGFNAFKRIGTTIERPWSGNISVGFSYFDTTLGKPIWYDGTNWVDATGETVN